MLTRCILCNAEVSPNSTICPTCGNPIKVEQKPAAPQVEPDPDREAKPQKNQTTQADYLRYADNIDYQLRVAQAEGYKLVGLVGTAMPGKTEFLKKLTELMIRFGYRADMGQYRTLEEQRQLTPTDPGKIQGYPLQKSRNEKYMVMDVGGEIFYKLLPKGTNWNEKDIDLTLTFLEHCSGFIGFIEINDRLIGDFPPLAGGYHHIPKDSHYAQIRDVFNNMILFIRWLNAGRMEYDYEHFNKELMAKVLAVIEETPRIKKPFIILFSKADLYRKSRLYTKEGSRIDPIASEMDANSFAKKYFPHLYRTLCENVDYFKFDFVSVYEEDANEEVIDGSPSYGVLSAFDFIQTQSFRYSLLKTKHYLWLKEKFSRT